MNTDTPPPASTDRFLRMARGASALACGAMAAFLYSLKRVNPTLDLELGAGSLLAAGLGAFLAWVIWNAVARMNTGEAVAPSRPLRWGMGLAAGILLVGTFAGFWIAIRDVRREALLQVIQGTALAVMVLSGIGWVLFKLTRLLNQGEPPEGSTGEPPPGQEEE
ncbi:MAG TPA: hypothetical protein DCM86_08890 [Verrucomicrobiales bacterium]|nr:hypothetical protein [Verrucomicrobiales bacterium]